MSWSDPKVVLRRIVPLCIAVSFLGLAANLYNACTRTPCKACPCVEAP